MDPFATRRATKLPREKIFVLKKFRTCAPPDAKRAKPATETKNKLERPLVLLVSLRGRGVTPLGFVVSDSEHGGFEFFRW